jgi:hypothetical protein
MANKLKFKLTSTKYTAITSENNSNSIEISLPFNVNLLALSIMFISVNA